MLGKKNCNSRCELIGRKRVFFFFIFLLLFFFKSRWEEKFKWRKKNIENK